MEPADSLPCSQGPAIGHTICRPFLVSRVYMSSYCSTTDRIPAARCCFVVTIVRTLPQTGFNKFPHKAEHWLYLQQEQAALLKSHFMLN